MKTKKKHKTDDELKQLAVDWVEGRIFTSFDIHPGDMPFMLTKVFMLISLGALAELSKKQLDDVGMIYEYMSEQGYRSVNGYPMFIKSLRWMTRADTERFKAYAREYLEQRKSFLKPQDPSASRSGKR